MDVKEKQIKINNFLSKTAEKIADLRADFGDGIILGNVYSKIYNDIMSKQESAFAELDEGAAAEDIINGLKCKLENEYDIQFEDDDDEDAGYRIEDLGDDKNVLDAEFTYRKTKLFIMTTNGIVRPVPNAHERSLFAVMSAAKI